MPMSVFLRTSWDLSMTEVCPSDADNVKESRFMLPHVKAQLHGVGADFVGLLVKWIGNLVSRLLLCGKRKYLVNWKETVRLRTLN